MKKILFGLLIISLSIFLIIGCGKNHDGGGTPVNSNNQQDPNNFFVVWSACLPASGEANVNANSNIIIVFNNPITFEGTDENTIGLGSLHTAGTPTGSVTFELSADQKTVTISGITGWMSIETEPNPPFIVNLITDGSLQDIYGNHLATGEALTNYSLATVFERYWPLNVGDTYVLINTTKEGTTPHNGIATIESTFMGYASFEAKLYNFPDNPLAKTTSSNIRFGIVGGGTFIVSAGNQPILLNNPIIPGQIITEVTSMAGETVTFETTVIGEETINTLRFGSTKTLRSNIAMIVEGVDSRYDFSHWLAYNYGLIKFDGTLTSISGTTPPSYLGTIEVIDTY